MSYYGTGDYYMAGDPGLLSSLGGFVKGAVRGAVGFLTGGPVGAAAAVLPSITGSRVGPAGVAIPRIAASPGPTVTELFTPSQQMLGQAFLQPGPNGKPRGYSGYHLNKTGYFLKSGQYVAPGTKWVRNRSRNFANGKALNRAITRTSGFNRMVIRSRKNLRALSKI